MLIFIIIGNALSFKTLKCASLLARTHWKMHLYFVVVKLNEQLWSGLTLTGGWRGWDGKNLMRCRWLPAEWWLDLKYGMKEHWNQRFLVKFRFLFFLVRHSHMCTSLFTFGVWIELRNILNSVLSLCVCACVCLGCQVEKSWSPLVLHVLFPFGNNEKPVF